MLILGMPYSIYPPSLPDFTFDVQVKELLAAQSRSRDGVIKMNPSTFSQYVSGKQRPFTLYMFLTANHLMDNPNMRLGPMRQDFGYMAKALKDRTASGEFKAPGTIFFAEAEYHESQEVRQKYYLFNNLMRSCENVFRNVRHLS